VKKHQKSAHRESDKATASAGESQPVLSSDPELVSDPVPDGAMPEEVGGPKGLEPTRFGDWERNGRCSDF